MNTLPVYRLLADYHCHPTWRLRDDDTFKNVSPEPLPLPPPLQADLLHWARIFDQTLDPADPTSSGFSTDLEHELFVSWGRSLGQAMASYLRHDIDYFDDRTQQSVVLRTNEDVVAVIPR